MHPIRVDTAFPGGAAGNVRIASENTVYFEAPLDGGTQSMWFYFRIRGCRGTRLQLVQTGLEQVLGVWETRTYAAVQPVVKVGDQGSWKRIPKEETLFSHDPLEYSFTVEPEEDTVYVAFSYPYTIQDLEQGLNALNPRYIRKSVLGLTSEGRDFPVCRISDGVESVHKRMIVCAARQHAGETPGSYVLEGMLGLAAEESEWGGRFRERFVLAAFPMADLDGVEAGRYGKNRAPVDLNRDWCYDPQRPEIRMMKAEIDRLASIYRYTAFLDLHAPQPGGNCFLLPARLSAMGEANRNACWEIFRRLEETTSHICACTRRDFPLGAANWSKENYQFTATGHQARKYGIKAMTLETSYHTDSQGKLLSVEDWRALGEQLLRALVRQDELEEEGKQPEPGLSPLKDTLWDQWETVTTPKHVEIAPINQDTLQLLSDRMDSDVWLTYRPFLSAESDSHTGMLLNIAVSHEESLEGEIYTYFYEQGEVRRHFTKESVRLKNGQWMWRPESLPVTTGDYRISIRVKGFAGKITIRMGVFRFEPV